MVEAIIKLPDILKDEQFFKAIMGQKRSEDIENAYMTAQRDHTFRETLKEVLDYFKEKCPHGKKKKMFPRADCSLCVWELVEKLYELVGGE